MTRTFFDERARYRRAQWRWTLLAGCAAVLLGLPLSLVLTPIIYLFALVSLNVVNGVIPISPIVWSVIDRLAALIPTAVEAYREGLTALLSVAVPVATALLLPGALTILLVWHGVRRLLDSVGLEATLQTLCARAPQESVLEERQFRDLVAEMSELAGIAPPPVWITEHLSPNMALLGNAPESAAIVASRRLINTCDVDETQALIAHVLASLANGDQLIALRVESVYLTGAALNAFVNAPFGRSGRHVLVALGGAFRSEASAEERTRALAALLREWSVPSNDLTRFFERDGSRPPSVWRHLLHLMLSPLYLLNMAVLVTAELVEAGIVAPAVAAVCRARRYLADASAAELHNASQLARALRNVARSLGDTHWAPARLRTVVASDVTDPWRSPGGLTNAHPPAEKRLKRLAAQGAVLTWDTRPATSGTRRTAAEMAGAMVLVPLFAATAYMSAIVVALVTLLAMGAMAMTLAAIHGVFQLLQ